MLICYCEVTAANKNMLGNSRETSGATGKPPSCRVKTFFRSITKGECKPGLSMSTSCPGPPFVTAGYYAQAARRTGTNLISKLRSAPAHERIVACAILLGSIADLRQQLCVIQITRFIRKLLTETTKEVQTTAITTSSSIPSTNTSRSSVTEQIIQVFQSHSNALHV